MAARMSRPSPPVVLARDWRTRLAELAVFLRCALLVLLSLLLRDLAVAQAQPATAGVARPRNVVGVGGLLFDDSESKSRPIGDGVYAADGLTWVYSGAVEVFVGRELFSAGGMPVTLELPVTYLPKLRQAPQDPLFDTLDLEQDAAFGAIYVVPRFTGAYPRDTVWQFVPSVGFGVARFSGASDEQPRSEVRYPYYVSLGVGARLGTRWAVRVGMARYGHARREWSLTAVSAAIVRRF